MASRRQQRKRECIGKRAFGNEALAAAFRQEIRERGGDDFEVYRCKSCGKFHLGHATNLAATSQTTHRLRRSEARWVIAERQVFRYPLDLRPAKVTTFNPPRLRPEGNGSG